VLLLLLGLIGGVGLAGWINATGNADRLSRQLDGGSPIRPIFLRASRQCRARTLEEVRLDNAMLGVAQAIKPSETNEDSPTYGYVVSYFAWHWSIADLSRIGECKPADDVIKPLAPILDATGWPRANTQLNDLRLVERLPPSKVLAVGLGRIAFLKHLPPTDPGGEDSRPYARQLLAEQGDFSVRWRDAALSDMNGDTRLGTSAAYLAVATAPDVALPLVEKIMAGKLRQSLQSNSRAFRNGSDIKAISSEDGNRLIELGYALARGGERADQYSQPVIAMLDQVIARPSPPFGLMAAEPTEFCLIARHIGGKPSLAAKAKPFCAANFKGGDGVPRDY
jgi:hypothetical protein